MKYHVANIISDDNFADELQRTVSIQPKIKVNSFLFISGLLLLAFSFSWVSPLITALITGSNLIELFIVFGFILIFLSGHPSAKVFMQIFQSKQFHIVVCLLLCFAVIGMLSGDGNISFVYADFRANLTFVFFIQFFTAKGWDKLNNKYREQFLVITFAAITFMDIISVALRPYLASDWVISKQPLLILAPALLAIFYIRKEKFFVSSIFIFAMLYQAVIGFYRFYYLTCIVIILLIAFLVFRNTFKRGIKSSAKLKSILLVTGIVVTIIVSAAKVYDYWTSSESRMIHSINRTEDFLNDTGTEKERIGSVNAILLAPERLIIPKGIGWRSFQKMIVREYEDFQIVSSMDSCFFYVAYHYGIIVFGLMIVFAAVIIIRSFKRKFPQDVAFDRIIRLAFLMLFVVSFSSHGIMFTTPQGAFVFGSFFAIILKPI